MKTYAVIPTRDRAGTLAPLLQCLNNDDVLPIVVDTGENDWLDALGVLRVPVARDPANISRWWNVGLDTAEHLADGAEFAVAVLNDDLVLAPETISRLVNVMVAEDAAASFPDVHQTLPPRHVAVLRVAKPHNLFHRMTGYCFVLRGSLRLRADESMAWWYGDDDLEWRAALLGGVVRVGGLTVEHLHPNSSTADDPGLIAQIGRDRETFIKKWKVPPW